MTQMMRIALPLIAFVIGPGLGKAQIQVQGHRGCRGYLPENTIPGFIRALEMGVDVLELDVVITGDGHVLVSHEPWMNPDICLGPRGQSLRGKKKSSIYKMTLAEIQGFDCGAIGNSKFPLQQAMFVQKPTLQDVFSVVETWLSEHPNHSCLFNIEIKRHPKYDHHFAPPVAEFCDRVIHEIDRAGMMASSNLQSFDLETLEYIHRTRPDISLAYLVQKGTVTKNLARISFQPNIYSPKYTLLNQDEVSLLHQEGLLVIPWTVNEYEDIQKMINLGVDGIITDYPDRVIQLRP